MYVLEKGAEILEMLTQDHLTDGEDSKEKKERDVEPFRQQVLHNFGFDIADHGIDPALGTPDEVRAAVWELATTLYDAKEQRVGPDLMRQYERHILLQIIDGAWKDHLLAMDHLKEGIGLRGYGQRDPLIEYKKESFELFEGLMNRIEEDTVRFLYLLQPVDQDKQAEQLERRRKRQQFVAENQGGGDPRQKTVKRDAPKVGRNAPCPCGSGKKYKKCHGASA